MSDNNKELITSVVDHVKGETTYTIHPDAVTQQDIDNAKMDFMRLLINRCLEFQEYFNISAATAYPTMVQIPPINIPPVNIYRSEVSDEVFRQLSFPIPIITGVTNE